MYGQDAGIGLAFQNSYGTQAAVGSLFQLPILNEDLGLSQEDLISENMNGRFDEGDSYSGQRTFGGQVEMEAQPLALGALLKAVIGDPTQVDSGSVATHTFNPRTADFDVNIAGRPVSYYKYLGDGGSAQLFYDLCGTRFELQQSVGGFLTARAALVGGKRASVASQALTLDDTPRWPWNTGSLSLGGASPSDFTDVSIVHDEAVEPRFTLDGALVANRVKRTGRRTVRIAGTLIFSDQSELDNFVDEATQQLILTFAGTTEIQSGYFNTLIVDVPQFKWIEFKPVVQGPGEIEVNFSGKGEYHAGSGQSVQYTLQNTYQAGY